MTRRWFDFTMFGREVSVTFGRFRFGLHRCAPAAPSWALSFGFALMTVVWTLDNRNVDAFAEVAGWLDD